jgi:CheY-like chemotaxis protein
MTNRTRIALYVEHDLDQRILVAAILEARGLSVSTAKSALNALELLSTEGFDVVMIYYKLPDMTGSQLAEEIRAVDRQVGSFSFLGHRVCLRENWHMLTSISLTVRS